MTRISTQNAQAIRRGINTARRHYRDGFPFRPDISMVMDVSLEVQAYQRTAQHYDPSRIPEIDIRPLPRVPKRSQPKVRIK